MALMAIDGGGQDEGGRQTRGLLLGRNINLRPDPPAKDLLNEPLVVSQLPEIDLPRETLGNRLSLLLFRTVLGYREEEYRALAGVRQTIAAVMASVSRMAAKELEVAGWVLNRREKGLQRVVRVTHPDQLQDAFAVLMAAPDAISQERQELEVLLAVVLRHYIKEMSAIIGSRFSFEAEAHSHCMHAYDLERQLKNVVDQYERMAVLQQTYDSYSNAASYYLYSLVSREPSEHDPKMFSMYVRAVFFISRLQYDGTLQENVNRRRLPLRREVMFLIKRDRALQTRYSKDEEFAEQIKNILNFFPTV